MATNAQYVNGESILPQARPAQAIEWVYANGASGDIGADEYVAGGGAAVTGIAQKVHHYKQVGAM